MAKQSLEKIRFPDKPLDLKPNEWQARTEFVRILTEWCTVSKWDTRNYWYVPVTFDYHGVEITYDLGNPYFGVASGRFRFDLALDPVELGMALGQAKAAMAVCTMPERDAA